ncbi:MAG: hypothetical protein WAQ28_03925 [Bacteroidia bacterium]|jgi:uncharacterized protein YxeA
MEAIKREVPDEVLLNNEDEQTTYDKGRELEIQFSVFMKHELKWEKVRVGAHMAGKANVKGAAIDVIGERLDERGRKFKTFAILWLYFAFCCIVASTFMIITELGTGEVFLFFAILLAIGGAVFMYQSGVHNKENAWVECKNLKGKVNINQIDKSVRELNDYKESRNNEYRFEYHYFVSASGYMENALKYAVDKGILCYQKEGNTFKRVGYWD